MTRRFITALGLLFAVLIAVVVWFHDSPVSVTFDQYARIKTGMTSDELEMLLGGPPRNEIDNPVMAWMQTADGKIVSVRIPPGPPTVEFFAAAQTEDNESRAVWLAETGLIAVRLGPDGKVIDKFFSEISNPGRPTVVDWIMSRPKQIGRRAGP